MLFVLTSPSVSMEKALKCPCFFNTFFKKAFGFFLYYGLQFGGEKHGNPACGGINFDMAMREKHLFMFKTVYKRLANKSVNASKQLTEILANSLSSFSFIRKDKFQGLSYITSVNSD